MRKLLRLAGVLAFVGFGGGLYDLAYNYVVAKNQNIPTVMMEAMITPQFVLVASSIIVFLIAGLGLDVLNKLDDIAERVEAGGRR